MGQFFQLLFVSRDVTFTRAGQGHSIEAVGNEPIEMIALILYEKESYGGSSAGEKN